MRVLADTNTILSALVFPKSVTAEALRYVFSRHRLVLCAYVVDEARDIVKRKIPSYMSTNLNVFFTESTSNLCSFRSLEPMR